MKNMKKLVALVLVLAMSLSMFAISALAAQGDELAYGAATTTASVLNIRSGPSTSYSVVGKINQNTRIVILQCTSSSWYKINYEGTVGYVSTDYLKDICKAENFTATGTVDGSGCIMRSMPNTSSSILGTYNKGTKMTVIGINNGWYKVQYNGKTGYMRSDLMNITGGASSGGSSSGTTSGTTSSLRQRIVNFALQYEGYRYVYGGESIAEGGFDCSGFIYFIFQSNFGYSMHRTASQQYANDGVKISKSELQPGDAVFFSDDGYGVTHVGLYIGNGQFIHAANSRSGVIISDLNSSYYSRVYWGAKRIVG